MPAGPRCGRPMPAGPRCGRPMPAGPRCGRPMPAGPRCGRPMPAGPRCGRPMPAGPRAGDCGWGRLCPCRHMGHSAPAAGGAAAWWIRESVRLSWGGGGCCLEDSRSGGYSESIPELIRCLDRLRRPRTQAEPLHGAAVTAGVCRARGADVLVPGGPWCGRAGSCRARVRTSWPAGLACGRPGLPGSRADVLASRARVRTSWPARPRWPTPADGQRGVPASPALRRRSSSAIQRRQRGGAPARGMRAW